MCISYKKANQTALKILSRQHSTGLSICVFVKIKVSLHLRMPCAAGTVVPAHRRQLDPEDPVKYDFALLQLNG